MRLGIMQPYFFPYIGYFQLIGAADVFILYDRIKYTKKGWINRNRILRNGTDIMLTLPIKADSDSLDIGERELAGDFSAGKMLRQIAGAYSRAPFYAETLPLLEQVIQYPDRNLFRFLHNCIVMTCRELGITTEIRVSSTVPVDNNLKNQEMVLALCEAVGATSYVNPIGGLELYSTQDFHSRGVDLTFLKARPCEYVQFGNEFVPWLSIIDVLMFNPKARVAQWIAGNYDLI